MGESPARPTASSTELVAGFVQKTDSLPLSLGNGAAGVVAGRYAFFAGSSKPDAADVYDAKTDRWSIAHLPRVRSRPVLASAGGRVLIAGPSPHDPDGNIVDLYDQRRGASSTTTAPQAIGSGAAATGVGNLVVFVASGTSAEAFDVIARHWTTSSLPASLQSGKIAAASLGSKAFFTDGTNVDVYDAATEQWTGRELPQVLGSAVAASAGDMLLLAAGDVPGSAAGAMDVYDATSDRWSAATMPNAMAVTAAASIARRTLFAGTVAGTDGAPPRTMLHVYDAATGTWSTIPAASLADITPTTAVTIDTKAIFAGRATADIVTDSAPAAALDANVRGFSGEDMTITLHNVGDAALTRRSLIALYASGSATDISGGSPLGQGRLRAPLPPGAAAEITFATQSIDGFHYLVPAIRTRSCFVAVAPAVVPTLPPPAVAASPFRDTQVRLPLLTEAYYGPVAAAGDTLIFGHAYQPDDSTRDRVILYNAASGAISVVRLARALGTAAASVGDKAIFAGADGTSEYTSVSHISDQVDIYDAATNQWSTARLSDPRTGVRAITVGTQAIFFGGWHAVSESGIWGPSDAVDIYDDATGQWTHARLSVARDGPAAVVGTKVIFGPGSSHGFPGPPDLVNVTDVYDAATGEWSIAPPAPIIAKPLTGAGGTVVGDKAVFSDGANAVFYDTETGQWTVKPLSQPNYRVNLLSAGGVAIIAGVEVPSVVDLFDAGMRRAAPPLRFPHDLSHQWSAAFDGKAVFLAESDDNSPDSLDVYDPARGEWSSVPLGTSWIDPLYVAGGRLIVLGGPTTSGGSLFHILTPTD